MKTSRKYSRVGRVILYPQLARGSTRPYPTQGGKGSLEPYPVQQRQRGGRRRKVRRRRRRRPPLRRPRIFM